jgi:O-antigen/teichoic acid export membrane protein
MSLRNSFFLSLLEKYSSLVITFISSIIIARLLSPEEVGIFSVTVAFTSMAHMLRDFGVGDYLIKERELTKDKVGTVFGLAIVFAWSVGGSLLLLAPYISAIFDEPGIKNVLHVLSINFFIIPFSSPILPVLRRTMQFDKLLRINLTSNFMHATAAISFAYYDYGYMSLAWASLVSVLTTFLLAQYYRPIETKVIPCFKEYKAILTFGGTVSLGMLFSELGRNSPELIIGKMLGFGPVGIFSRGQGLVRLFQASFLGAIAPVIQSEFADQFRKEKDVGKIYYKNIEYVTSIIWPVNFFIAIFSEEIILTLFGDQWIEAAPIVTALCLPAVIRSLFAFGQKVLIASGEAARILKIVAVVESLRIICTFVGALFSLTHIAWLFSLVSLTGFALYSYQLNLLFNIRVKEVLASSLKSLYVSVLSIVPSVLIFNAASSADLYLLIKLFISFLVLMVSWCISVFVVNHSIKKELLSIVRMLRKL